MCLARDHMMTKNSYIVIVTRPDSTCEASLQNGSVTRLKRLLCLSQHRNRYRNEKWSISETNDNDASSAQLAFSQEMYNLVSVSKPSIPDPWVAKTDTCHHREAYKSSGLNLEAEDRISPYSHTWMDVWSSHNHDEPNHLNALRVALIEPKRAVDGQNAKVMPFSYQLLRARHYEIEIVDGARRAWLASMTILDMSAKTTFITKGFVMAARAMLG